MEAPAYLIKAEQLLEECDAHLLMAEMINDYLEVFYDQNLKPSLLLDDSWEDYLC